MENVTQATLTDAVKQLTALILGQLVTHKIKGADLISKGVDITAEIIENTSAIVELLKTLAPLLLQAFEAIKSWLVSAYGHLVEAWEWAKALWHKIFG